MAILAGFTCTLLLGGWATLRGDLEILSLAGSLSPDGAHLHIAVADARGRVTGGHVAQGCIVRTTAEILLALLPDVRFRRAPDARTGCQELVIEPPATARAS